jgi:hypothetical protein
MFLLPNSSEQPILLKLLGVPALPSRLDEEMTEHRHGEGGKRGCDRAKPDLAALVRQRHVLRHERDFPFLVGVVKF